MATVLLSSDDISTTIAIPAWHFMNTFQHTSVDSENHRMVFPQFNLNIFSFNLKPFPLGLIIPAHFKSPSSALL